MVAREQRQAESVGIYRIPDAANYLAVTLPRSNGSVVSARTLSQWVSSSVARTSQARLPTGHRMLTFTDLISLRMVAILRDHQVPIAKIRDTEEWATSQFGIEWPFALRPLWTYGSDVFVEFGQKLVAASRFGQQAMAFLRDYLREIPLDMTFDESDLADSWSPNGYLSVTLDPNIQFGEPCIRGTRIPTNAIWAKANAGDGLPLIARMYDLPLDQVEGAIDWEQHIRAA